MIVGRYALDLYCDAVKCNRKMGYGAEPGTFTGKNKTEATRNARNAGWALTHKNENYPQGRVRCPDCRGKT